MSLQLLYMDDPLTLEFQANIIEIRNLAVNKWCVRLDQSYFYPTGGGQECDFGFINEARVEDVYKQGDPPVVIHVINKPLLPGPATCKIDAERRMRHMQHHTAQHLLTQCFFYIFDLETLSANINGYTPSTLDLPIASLDKAQLEQVEKLANQIIYEDRPVRSYFVMPDELATIPVRRTPKVIEDIRVVEIDKFDYTPCGGTHCISTGQIGVIKIIKTEKQNDRTRVHFTAGWQALGIFKYSFDILSGLAWQMSVSMQDLPAILIRQSEQLQQAQKELQILRTERIGWEALRLVDTAKTIGNRQVILAHFTGRPVSDLRTLAGELSKHVNTLAVLYSLDDKKLSILVACGAKSDLIARDVLTQLLAPINGRGGGDARLAQGGGNLSETGDIEKRLWQILDEIILKFQKST